MLKFHSLDSGFCRVYYQYINPKGDKFLYCMQPDHDKTWRLYRCSMDGEPESAAQLKSWEDIELPPGDSIDEIEVRTTILFNRNTQ